MNLMLCSNPDRILTYDSEWPQLDYRLPHGYINPMWYKNNPDNDGRAREIAEKKAFEELQGLPD